MSGPKASQFSLPSQNYVAKNDATKVVPQKYHVPKKGEKILNPLGQFVADTGAGIKSTFDLAECGAVIKDSQATGIRKQNQQNAETQMKNYSLFTYKND